MSTSIDDIINRKIQHILSNNTNIPKIVVEKKNTPNTYAITQHPSTSAKSKSGGYGVVFLGILILAVIAALIYILCT